LSDRGSVPEIPGFKANVSQDVKWIFYDVLKKIEQTNINIIDLFIYTRGGDTNAVWPIVSLFREYCEIFNVMVPFRCHSSGTLICLGANKILMSRLGELSPIDPTTGNQFNPIDEFQNNRRKGISVEDLTSYFELARENFGIRDNEALEIFKQLTTNVHPLSLGNVKRVLVQIRLLANKLLALHMNSRDHESQIEEIIESLTVKLFSHLHFINRKEAKKIFSDSIIESPEPETEKLMLELLQSYMDTLKCEESFSVFNELGGQPNRPFDFISGIIESENTSFIYNTNVSVSQMPNLPPNFNLNLQLGQPIPIIPGFPRRVTTEILSQGWKNNEGGI
jgi:hypothetical protein